MKRNILLFSLIIFALAACKKKEYEVKMSLTGDAVYRVVLNMPYVDPGATAHDHWDKELTVTVNDDAVNVDHTGDYIVSYTATDADGNIGTIVRTVVVYNEAEYLAGEWSVARYPEGQGNPDSLYFETLEFSDFKNRDFVFTQFSGYINASVIASIQANYIVIDTIICAGLGQSGTITATFFGDGLQTSNKHFQVNYSQIILGDTSKYSAVYTRDF